MVWCGRTAKPILSSSSCLLCQYDQAKADDEKRKHQERMEALPLNDPERVRYEVGEGGRGLDARSLISCVWPAFCLAALPAVL